MEHALKKIPIFAEYSGDELRLVKKYFSLHHYEEAEEILAAAGSNKLHIVVEGRIKSSVEHSISMKRSYGEFCRGDFFGEISIFAHKPLGDSYYAAEKSSLVTIDRHSLETFTEEQPGLALTFFSSLLSKTIQQLRASSTFLADIVQWGEEASRRVITDELTGVYNRAFLEDALENFFNISKSNNKPLSLFMVDLDNFREINERLGLETGNIIIHTVVALVRGIISRHGIIARYGGDEFSILLPEADLHKALVIAEQIRAKVEAHDFSPYTAGSEVAITTSIGISTYPETATEFDTFKQNADAALYRAKAAGRNRVMYIE